MAYSQPPCDKPSAKKHSKILEQAATSKAPPAELAELLNSLVDELPDNAHGWMELGRVQFRIADKEDIPDYKQAKNSLNTAITLCSEINPLAYYYLGLINYATAEYKEALQHFEKFITYTGNPSDKDHAVKLADVKRSIPVIIEENRKAADINTFAGVTPKKIQLSSTEKSEYLPMLSPDNSLLFFTRKYEKMMRGDVVNREVEEFVQARRTSSALEFEVGQPLKPPFNLGDNYGGVTLSLNNKEMFITVCAKDSTGYRNCDIFISRYLMERLDSGKTGYKWGDLRRLGSQINRPDSWEAQPSISPDGLTLYFTRYGTSTKQTDIYFAVKDSLGNWQEAQPLNAINTEGHDKAPFLHQDGRTMYFSSSARPGKGGFDIYMSKKNDAGEWSTPLNIGEPVNTSADEHGLLVSTDGHYAIYATNTEDDKKNFDIYSFELPANMRPEDIVMVKGKVENADENTRIQLKKADGRTIKNIEIDKDDGAYATILLKKEISEPVLLTIEEEGAAFDARLIDAASEQNGLIDNRDLSNQKLSENQPYRINDINFETNQAVLSEISKLILNEFAAFLKKNSMLKVIIQGHTDNVGDDAANMILSNDRALAVKSYLVSVGISEKRLRYKGFGASSPVAENTTETGRAKNRRTEFVVLK